VNDAIFDLWREALELMISVSAPFLVTGLALGLVIAIFQAATQLQDSVLTFVPKLAAAAIVIALAGHWAIDKLGRFTREAFETASEVRPPDPPPRSP
jgi:flagellar biosynthetic protein FliQ